MKFTLSQHKPHFPAPNHTEWYVETEDSHLGTITQDGIDFHWLVLGKPEWSMPECKSLNALPNRRMAELECYGYMRNYALMQPASLDEGRASTIEGRREILDELRR